MGVTTSPWWSSSAGQSPREGSERPGGSTTKLTGWGSVGRARLPYPSAPPPSPTGHRAAAGHSLYVRFATGSEGVYPPGSEKGRQGGVWGCLAITLHPELQQSITERRAAGEDARPGDSHSRTRWIEAKRRGSQVEARVSQEQFRDFVSTKLNRPTSVGRVSRLLHGGRLRWTTIGKARRCESENGSS